MRDFKQHITAGIIMLLAIVTLFIIITERTVFTPASSTGATPYTSVPSLGNVTDENIPLENRNAVEFIKEPINFSHEGGFYEEAFFLKLSPSYKEGAIYYTLDGSDPDPENINHAEDRIGYRRKTFLYTEPIFIPSRDREKNAYANIPSGPFMPELPDEEVFMATIVKAMVIDSNAEQSKTIATTYFVGEGATNRYSLPVISIITDENNLFGGDNGIYVPGDNCVDFNENTANYFQRGIEWERPIHIELYEKNGQKAFSEKAGIRIHGGVNRQSFQKSLRIYMRKDYGSRWLNYELFRDTPFQANYLSAYKRFVLRAESSEGFQTIIRDGLMQNLVEHMNIDVQSYRPVNVFLNGEYWGIHSIRERLDKYYVATHHGVDAENIDLINNPSVTIPVPSERIAEGDDQHYSNMIQFMLDNDMSQDENYEIIKSMIDIDNFIDCHVAQIYFANFDWPQNNVKIWRPRTPNGKWRWMMFDVDAGFLRAPNRQTYSYGHSNPDFNALVHATCEVHEGLKKIPEYTFILRTLLENETFRMAFINRFADCLNTCFDSSHVISLMDMMTDHISPDIPEYKMKWGYPRQWEEMLESMRFFVSERPSYQRQHILEYFDLDGMVQVTIDPNPNGIIKINSVDVQSPAGDEGSEQWTGIYFSGAPVHLEAIAQDGYQFVGWEGAGELNGQAVTLDLQNDITIKAIFQPN